MKPTKPTLPPEQKRILQQKAKKLRRSILRMISVAGSGHPGGSLSCIDILTVLFFKHMTRHDHFVLSKGHAAPALYAMLAHKRVIKPSQLNRLRKLGSPLQAHPDSRFLPQLEVCTGSLGQGISVAVGMALGAKLKRQNSRIFVLLGDGEINEGQVWEAGLSAAHHRLDNLTVIIDKNGLQQTGTTDQVLTTNNLAKKWQSFNWTTLTINGHDLEQINWALQAKKITRKKPTMIIANTIKGKGVSFMEGNLDFHGKAPTQEELSLALAELR